MLPLVKYLLLEGHPFCASCIQLFTSENLEANLSQKVHWDVLELLLIATLISWNRPSFPPTAKKTYRNNFIRLLHICSLSCMTAVTWHYAAIKPTHLIYGQYFTDCASCLSFGIIFLKVRSFN